VGPNELCIVPWQQIHQLLKIELKFLHFPSLRQKKFKKLLVAMQLKKLVISHDLPSNQTYLRRQ
jgi:hypothetical protein